MSVLLIVENSTTDITWIAEYIEKVTPLVASFGGHYLTRSSNIEIIEGQDKPQTLVLAQFPSKEAAVSFYHSEAYQPYRDARIANSTGKMLLVDMENGTKEITSEA